MSTSIEGTLEGMSMRSNLQIAKAKAITTRGHQNAIVRLLRINPWTSTSAHDFHAKEDGSRREARELAAEVDSAKWSSGLPAGSIRQREKELTHASQKMSERMLAIHDKEQNMSRLFLSRFMKNDRVLVGR
ncbi:threonine--tRNA ligase [Striga asiatica]|uniref:Threonine--tRNA ligase n=1 Tax=Striga asiatica TaxID=4170 RepID=A0A5A7NZC3_STRAF|nr:threonine--tRNA ligase [Striga asiatica]